MEWFYVENGQQAGPVDETSLAELVRQGRVNAQTLVWNSTMSNWLTYSEVTAQMAAGAVATELPNAPATPPGAPATAYCAECGRPFPVEEMVQYGNSCVCADCKGVFFQKVKEGVSVPGQFVYAGFWIRAGAKIIDGILLFAVGIVIGLVTGAGTVLAPRLGPSIFPTNGSSVSILSMIVQYAVAIGYYVYMHGRYGQTLGKMACGIRVIRPNGEPISYMRAFGRYFADILSGMILYIGYIMVGFDDQKRALHDRICDTRVVYKQ
jgi:uncharacterized RDD family membrane protein YckC